MQFLIIGALLPCMSLGTNGYVTGFRDHNLSGEPLYVVPVRDAWMFPRTAGMAIRGPDNVVEYIPREPRQSGISQGIRSNSRRAGTPNRSSSRERNQPVVPVASQLHSSSSIREIVPSRSSSRSSRSSSRTDSRVSCNRNRSPNPPPLDLPQIERFIATHPVSSSNIASIWTHSGAPQLVHNLMCSQSPGPTPARTVEQLRAFFLIIAHIVRDEPPAESSSFLKESHAICSRHYNQIKTYMQQEYRNLWDHRNRVGSRFAPYWNYHIVCPKVSRDPVVLRYIVLNRVVRSIGDRSGTRQAPTATIPRINLLDSTVNILGDYRSDWTRYSSFYIRLDGEVGMDRGGLTAEWMTLFGRAMIEEEFLEPTSGGMFRLNATRTQALQSARVYFTFGRMLAISLLTDTYVSLPLSLGIAKYLVGEPVKFSDLKREDPQLHRQMDISGEDLESLELVFTATDRRGRERELKPNGEKTRVTRSNAAEWKSLMAKWQLVTQIEKGGLEYVKQGFSSILSIGSVFGKGFSAKQVMHVLTGNVRPVKGDLEKMISFDFHLNVNISESRRRQLVGWFWDFINSLSSEEIFKFMKFATATGVVDYKVIRVFFEDFSRRTRHGTGTNDNSFPETHTCTRTVDVPLYSSGDIMKEKFSKALSHGIGNIDRF